MKRLVSLWRGILKPGVLPCLFSSTLLVAVAVLFAAPLVAQQQEPTSQRALPSEFVIFPWGGMPGDLATSESWGPLRGDIPDINAAMKDLYDCGFNVSGFTGPQNLKPIRNNRLVGILADIRDNAINVNEEITPEEADKRIQNLLGGITDPEDRKAVFAIYLRDEPSAALFPKLSIWSEAVKKQGLLPYINLYPELAKAHQLGTKDYQEHLDQYVEICKPPYISYDNYSLYADGTFNEDDFYSNLESIRNKSLGAKIPFWNVILSNTHFEFAEPSDATLAVQAYSTLAYGGRGIGYFTYYTPQVGNYRLAPIDRFGHRTKTWGMVRNINLQIHSLVPVYGKLTSVNVFHIGNIPRHAKGIESAKLIASAGRGSQSLLVGEFVDPDGKPYAMIVNKSIRSSIRLVNVAFKSGGQVQAVSSYNMGVIPFSGEQCWLAPGYGVLLTCQ